MSDQDDFDARLAAHFEREHRHVPADAFVAATMRKVRVQRRRAQVVRTVLQVAALILAVAASPWLIAGVERLNAVLQSSLDWTMALPGAWALGAALAVIAVLAMRRRGR